MNIIITDLLAAGVGAFFGGLRSLLSDVLNTDYDHYRWGTHYGKSNWFVIDWCLCRNGH